MVADYDQKQTAIMKKCARIVALIAVGIVSISLTIGWIADHRVELTTWLTGFVTSAMYCISIGGEFWGAVTVGALAQTVAAWSGCVIFSSMEIDKARFPLSKSRQINWLLALCIACIALWGLACAAMHTTYATYPYSELSSYQQIASMIIDLPMFIAGFFVVGCTVVTLIFATLETR